MGSDGKAKPRRRGRARGAGREYVRPLWLTEELYDRLAARARANGRPVAWEGRDLLAAALDAPPPQRQP